MSLLESCAQVFTFPVVCWSFQWAQFLQQAQQWQA
jgi:hypothetical protein